MYGGGSYPGYSSTSGSGLGGTGGLSSSIGPYPSDPTGGYWGHAGGHGADIPPYLGQGAFGSTPAIIGSSIPPYSPTAIPGGLPPIGGSPLGPPLGLPGGSVPGYYGGAGGIGGIGGVGGGIGGIGGGGGIGGIGGGGGGGIGGIRCDDTDGFKQVSGRRARPEHATFSIVDGSPGLIADHQWRPTFFYRGPLGKALGAPRTQNFFP